MSYLPYFYLYKDLKRIIGILLCVFVIIKVLFYFAENCRQKQQISYKQQCRDCSDITDFKEILFLCYFIYFRSLYFIIQILCLRSEISSRLRNSALEANVDQKMISTLRKPSLEFEHEEPISPPSKEVSDTVSNRFLTNRTIGFLPLICLVLMLVYL